MNTTETNRREFEEWAHPKGYYLRKNSYIDITAYYESTDTEQALEAWQAARERQSTYSSWVVAKVISLPFGSKAEAESCIETMKDGVLHKESQLIVLPNPPTSEKPLTHTREQYEKLKASGMMWEIFPNFTGNYEEDVLNPPTSENI